MNWVQVKTGSKEMERGWRPDRTQSINPTEKPGKNTRRAK